ncbi:MAG: LysR substrate-binding domain-containing protein [Gammaproteobacteria bacterium]|nr:LysR substrate-binding domain-containing protein [Gammaproteobacteria bacterium]
MSPWRRPSIRFRPSRGATSTSCSQTAPIKDPALVYEPLFAVEMQIAVAPDHPRAAQEWFSPADLATETLISYPVRRSRLHVFTDFLEPSDVEPAHLLPTELPSLMVHLVARGRGVCCMPRWMRDELAGDAQVALRPLGETGMWCNLYIAAKPDRRRLPHVAGFVRVAREMLSGMLLGIEDPRPLSLHGLICPGSLTDRDSQRDIVRPHEARRLSASQGRSDHRRPAAGTDLDHSGGRRHHRKVH